MTPLNIQQKQLLFDYSLGLTSEHETSEAERMVAASQEAAAVYHTFKHALSPLDSLEPEPCPDELAERTIARLANQAQIDAGPDRLQELLTAEQAGTSVIRMPFWRNWGDLAAVAAVIVLFAGVLLPTLGMARQKYYKSRCQAQLSGIHNGLVSYVAEHDDRLPSVAKTPGAPGWKVGYQGQENYSHTRQPYLLVKGGYVAPQRFICPSRRDGRRLNFDTLNFASYNDFPSSAFMHYSAPVWCPQAPQRGLTGTRAIMADRNPISEVLPSDHSQTLRLRLVPELLTSNSENHNRSGQNVLQCDGSVQWTRERHTSSSEDDIYTVSEMTDGCEVSGCEAPSCETDTFLFP